MEYLDPGRYIVGDRCIAPATQGHCLSPPSPLDTFGAWGVSYNWLVKCYRDRHHCWPYSFSLRRNVLVRSFMKKTHFRLSLILLCVTTAFLTVLILRSGQNLLAGIVVAISLLLTAQGIFTLIWMLYAWENPSDSQKHKSPEVFIEPKFSFTALLPARHEESVITQTINAISKINYPSHLTELLVLCREDDVKTINSAKVAIASLNAANIRLITLNGSSKHTPHGSPIDLRSDLNELITIFDTTDTGKSPINKPHSLNVGLLHSQHDVVVIFDAEDQPHRDIYQVVNTVMTTSQADVVQSGVQLMNFRSHWFSAMNVMEYFFWFKSGLNFFSRIFAIAPLGGNTVFFKKTFLEKVGGWDETCLTEDADLGFRLVTAGAKIKVVYDELHVTQEETPGSVSSFIKQRTRWDQGFLQVLGKGEWLKLNTLRQKMFVLYLLVSPEIQIFLMLYFPIGLWIGLTQKLPVVISLLSFIPMYVLGVQMIVTIVGLYEFTNLYHQKFPIWMPLKMLLIYIPYQFLLTISSFRAIGKSLVGSNVWEKTAHTNAHRPLSETVFVAPKYATEFAG